MTIFIFGRSYKLLNVLEFSSARKRMSVIVRDEEGNLLLLSKGADRFVILYITFKYLLHQILNLVAQIS